MAELAASEELAAADAVSDDMGIGVTGYRLDFGGGFGGEALVGIDYKEPGILIRDFMDAPGAMEAFVAAIGDG
jgi:hypothetical protein